MSIYSLLYMYNHCNLQVCHRSKISVLQSIAIGAVGYGECCLQELQSLMPPFEVILNHMHASEKVLQYRGVISKSLQLVHSGEYVELCVPFEVWIHKAQNVLVVYLFIFLSELQVWSIAHHLQVNWWHCILCDAGLSTLWQQRRTTF